MRGNEKERVTPSENQGEERGSAEEGEEVTKTKDRGLARREKERESVSVTSNKIACSPLES